MRPPTPTFLSAAIITLAFSTPEAWPDAYAIDTENSLIAVITHKAGKFAWLAHNHLIYAQEYEAELTIDGDDLTTAAFRIEFPAENLVVSDVEGHDRWNSSILKAGLLEKPLDKTSAKNREKIRQNMLSKKQLDAEKYPNITATLTRLREDTAEEPGHTHTHLATVEITLHGQTITRDFPAKAALEGDTLTLEAVVSCNFSDFGIKPYSALAGAVKNQDFFDFYIILRATRISTSN